VVLSHVEKTTVAHVRTTSRKNHQDDLEEETIEKKSANHEEGGVHKTEASILHERPKLTTGE
jgi:hypothetical protein